MVIGDLFNGRSEVNADNQQVNLDEGSHGTNNNASDHNGGEEGWGSDQEKPPAKEDLMEVSLQQEVAADPMKRLPQEDRDLLESLDKWEISRLTQRFMDRLSHLKTNHATREDLSKKIIEWSKVYEVKQQIN